jgi:hypothetical protein
MALINCPECKNTVSDQASSCPHCGYPIAGKRMTQQSNHSLSEIVSSQNSPRPNQELVIVLDPKKNEGLAFLLTFLFGPLGVFYVDSMKALILIAIGVIPGVLLMTIDDLNVIYFSLLLYGFLWIISIIIAVLGVSEHNGEISSKLSKSYLFSTNSDNTTEPYDLIRELRKLIKLEKKKSFIVESEKEKIIAIIDEFCVDKARCFLLMNDYRYRFKADLIKDLKSLTTSYDLIKRYLQAFINFEVVKTEYPHEITNDPQHQISENGSS